MSATARNAINIYIANHAVAQFVTGDVADSSQYETRTVRKHLASLFSAGLLKKKGERGGWSLAEWLLTDLNAEGPGNKLQLG